MNSYVEWLQKCVNGAFHPQIEVGGLTGYGSALLWQMLFLLTITVTAAVVPAAVGIPFAGPVILIKTIVKKAKNKAYKIIPKYWDDEKYLHTVKGTSIKWAYIEGSKLKDFNRIQLSTKKKVHAILLTLLLTVQFLLLPFAFTITSGGLNTALGVIFYVILVGWVIYFLTTVMISASEMENLYGFWLVADAIVTDNIWVDYYPNYYSYQYTRGLYGDRDDFYRGWTIAYCDNEDEEIVDYIKGLLIENKPHISSESEMEDFINKVIKERKSKKGRK